MNAICLVIDRLHAGYLGAYGNGWIETPAFDRLAAESFLFDQMLIDTPQLQPLYRSYWQGSHALAGADDRLTLPAALRASGVHTALLSDEDAVYRHPLATDFNEIIAFEPPRQAQVAPEGAAEQTHLARCFAQIIEWMQSAPRPYLLWCHLAALGLTWDAPLEFRQLYSEPDGPEPRPSADVPDLLLPEDGNPDEAVAFAQAYAGQVSLLDACLGGLCKILRAQETLLVVTSSRGFPLAEHRRFGPCDEAIYGELVHVPLVVRFPDGLGASARSQALVEPADLMPTLLDYWQIANTPPASAASLLPIIRGDAVALRDRLVVAGRGTERGLRTPAWYLRAVEDPELYVKPDDHWEANNVAIRCQEVVQCLQDTLLQTEQALRTGRTSDLPPLTDVLVEGLE